MGGDGPSEKQQQLATAREQWNAVIEKLKKLADATSLSKITDQEKLSAELTSRIAEFSAYQKQAGKNLELCKRYFDEVCTNSKLNAQVELVTPTTPTTIMLAKAKKKFDDSARSITMKIANYTAMRERADQAVKVLEEEKANKIREEAAAAKKKRDEEQKLEAEAIEAAKKKEAALETGETKKKKAEKEDKSPDEEKKKRKRDESTESTDKKKKKEKEKKRRKEEKTYLSLVEKRMQPLEKLAKRIEKKLPAHKTLAERIRETQLYAGVWDSETRVSAHIGEDCDKAIASLSAIIADRETTKFARIKESLSKL